MQITPRRQRKPYDFKLLSWPLCEGQASVLAANSQKVTEGVICAFLRFQSEVGQAGAGGAVKKKAGSATAGAVKRGLPSMCYGVP
ncbi:hypothetical protein CA264_07940 [Pontibacter actiniarum]|uniref:Uncharacterized protein n=1 Tax=Pontibacter actiniarum TaxID=323450 RepID=A0A1X9YR68_9BACT|nr:hypothetical protein CA264_07940 [Pontibacter actiniarum]